MKAVQLQFDTTFTSVLRRAIRTLELALDVLGQSDLPVEQDQALNERHYGDLQGLNKAETAHKFGDEQVRIWRRSYDVPPPGGESLENTATRTLPYLTEKILPTIQAGQHVLVAAHGNSLRSIIMHLDQLSQAEVLSLELGTGVPVVYDLDTTGSVKSKKIL